MAVAVTLAVPVPLVATEPLDNVALGPEEGAVKVTVTPTDGLPAASRTTTCSGVTKAVPTCADCGVPPVAVMLEGGPEVLVREKNAESAPSPATPPMLAVTV